MKLTNEERGHIMMLYPNAEIKVADSTKHYTLAGIVEGKCYVRGSQGVMKIRVADICQLILRSLEDITDGEKEQLSELCYMAEFPGYIEDMLGYFKKGPFEDWHLSSTDVLAVTDKLREWGYALPYKGQDLFTLGIATTKSK